jgi:hypothetical protein
VIAIVSRSCGKFVFTRISASYAFLYRPPRWKMAERVVSFAFDRKINLVLLVLSPTSPGISQPRTCGKDGELNNQKRFVEERVLKKHVHWRFCGESLRRTTELAFGMA